MKETRTLLIRYDEIGLKGKNRKYFENKLVHNIRHALKGIEDVRIDKIHGRILGRVNMVDSQECVTRLTFIPGIASVTPIMQPPETTPFSLIPWLREPTATAPSP